jgi:Cd2+/Zn2+-exporting ATPase
MANTATEKDHDHKAHDHSSHDHSAHKHEPVEESACCGGDTGNVALAASSNAKGRSFQVNGLDCAEEVSILTKVVGPKLGGAEHLAFDVINGRMTVLDSAGLISDDQIVKLVATTGMSARPWNAENASVDQAAHLSKQKKFTFLSGGFWAAGFGWHIVETGMGGALGLFGVWLVAPKAWSSARRMSPDMNLLMVVAVAGAIVLGEYFEAATVAFFFSLSLYLESWSVGRARNAVSTLLDLAPPTARVVKEDGSEADVPAAEVTVGTHFIVRGGDRIALDGEVVDGAGAVDQAPITGESALVPKEAGDDVYAGTINGEGTLTVRATKAATDSVLSKIIRMVGDAHSRRAEVEQWVTKFARVYTPIVMILAVVIAVLPPLLLGGAWNYWFYNALVLLVIACPCALVISTPVSIVAALTASARAGVLIKGGAYIEAPGRTKAIALDRHDHHGRAGSGCTLSA